MDEKEAGVTNDKKPSPPLSSLGFPAHTPLPFILLVPLFLIPSFFLNDILCRPFRLARVDLNCCMPLVIDLHAIAGLGTPHFAAGVEKI